MGTCFIPIEKSVPLNQKFSVVFWEVQDALDVKYNTSVATTWHSPPQKTSFSGESGFLWVFCEQIL